MEDKVGNWMSVVNTGYACGIPKITRIDDKGKTWIAVGVFTLAIPPHVWDYLVREVHMEREKQAIVKAVIVEANK